MTLVLRAAAESRDVLMCDLIELACAHRGNDILEIEIPTDTGSRLFRVTQTVDSWDRALRVELERLGMVLQESPAP